MKIKEIAKTDPGVAVKFDSVEGRLYTIEYSNDPASDTWTMLQADIPGTGGSWRRRTRVDGCTV